MLKWTIKHRQSTNPSSHMTTPTTDKENYKCHAPYIWSAEPFNQIKPDQINRFEKVLRDVSNSPKLRTPTNKYVNPYKRCLSQPHDNQHRKRVRMKTLSLTPPDTYSKFYNPRRTPNARSQRARRAGPDFCIQMSPQGCVIVSPRSPATPLKHSKITHINDFFKFISTAASPEDITMQYSTIGRDRTSFVSTPKSLYVTPPSSTRSRICQFKLDTLKSMEDVSLSEIFAEKRRDDGSGTKGSETWDSREETVFLDELVGETPNLSTTERSRNNQPPDAATSQGLKRKSVESPVNQLPEESDTPRAHDDDDFDNLSLTQMVDEILELTQAPEVPDEYLEFEKHAKEKEVIIEDMLVRDRDSVILPSLANDTGRLEEQLGNFHIDSMTGESVRLETSEREDTGARQDTSIRQDNRIKGDTSTSQNTSARQDASRRQDTSMREVTSPRQDTTSRPDTTTRLDTSMRPDTSSGQNTSATQDTSTGLDTTAKKRKSFDLDDLDDSNYFNLKRSRNCIRGVKSSRRKKNLRGKRLTQSAEVITTKGQDEVHGRSVTDVTDLSMAEKLQRIEFKITSKPLDWKRLFDESVSPQWKDEKSTSPLVDFNRLTLQNGIPSPDSALEYVHATDDTLVVIVDHMDRRSETRMEPEPETGNHSDRRTEPEQRIVDPSDRPIDSEPNPIDHNNRQIDSEPNRIDHHDPRTDTEQRIVDERLETTPLRFGTIGVAFEPGPIEFMKSMSQEPPQGMTSPAICKVPHVIHKLDTTETPRRARRIMRRCLSFQSPSMDVDGERGHDRFRRVVAGDVDGEGGGVIELGFKYVDGKIHVHVVRCLGLRRKAQPINAYVKVSLSSDPSENLSTREHSFASGLYRTSVHKNSSSPFFDHLFRLETDADSCRSVLLTVWHRDKENRRSEFLGSVSVPVRQIVQQEINAQFKLLPYNFNAKRKPVSQSIAAIHVTHALNERTPRTMCDATLDKCEQRMADENLFLRYLELDPTDGPDAIPVAVQRNKIPGKPAGRTPFTTTKMLVKTDATSYGFSVVWTHPPRIERVEKGLAAERAAILPGDYIIFVDKFNVVMMAEADILNLIRTSGNQLILETFRRGSQVLPTTNGNCNGAINGRVNGQATGQMGQLSQVGQVSHVGQTSQMTPMELPSTIPPHHVTGIKSFAASAATILPTNRVGDSSSSRPCSTNTASDCHRRKLFLPQVTFCSENLANSNDPEEIRNRTLYQIIFSEQQYCTQMQFAVGRFVAPLLERPDLISSTDHRILFQNSQELLQLSEDIVDVVVHDTHDPQLHLVPKIYLDKLPHIAAQYKKYCTGLKKADCVLVNKTKTSADEFVQFLTTPPIPRRRVDIIGFIHKPLQHYREMLRLLQVLQMQTKPSHDDYVVVARVVQELQIVYREITSTAGLMEPIGEGRPLLSIQDLESRLVFTKCKPFHLNVPGRQWIFGGDLIRVEGRNTRPYWTLLFNDILLFAKVSRDRVLFITEEPLQLAAVSDVVFNVRKKVLEFRINISINGKPMESPTTHCGSTKAAGKNGGKRCVVLRAPSIEMKAVWQSLLQKQIHIIHSGQHGTPFSSPGVTPDDPRIMPSAMTLHSGDTYSVRPQSAPVSFAECQKRLDELIEQKCLKLGKTVNNKGGALHLAQWIKGQYGDAAVVDAENNVALDEEETLTELWTEEKLRKRSEELNLLKPDMNCNNKISPKRLRHLVVDVDSHSETLILSDVEEESTKSTNSDGKVTVRTSPTPAVPVCRQCHEKCLNNACKNKCHHAINANFDMDPFVPRDIPKVSVLPPTPDLLSRSASFHNKVDHSPQTTTNIQRKESEESTEDSPLTDEPPYHVMVSKTNGMKRYGTWSSLSRIPSEELVEDSAKNSSDDDEENPRDVNQDRESDELKEFEQLELLDDGTTTQSFIEWTARAATTYVAEKMALFEKFSAECRNRSQKPTDKRVKTNSECLLDDDLDNSCATSGEEIWGTPTSGDIDDIAGFSNSQSDVYTSPQESDELLNDDDDDLMMDELLMAPPMTPSIVRGLLPRHTLEPLLEEDDSESCSNSAYSKDESSRSASDQENDCGNVVDEKLSAAVVVVVHPPHANNQSTSNVSTCSNYPAKSPPPPPPPPRRRTPIASSLVASRLSSIPHYQIVTVERTTVAPPQKCQLIRADSYKQMIDEVEANSACNGRKLTTAAVGMAPFKSPTVTPVDIDHDVIVNPSADDSTSAKLLEYISKTPPDNVTINSCGAVGDDDTFGTRRLLNIFTRDKAFPYARPYSPKKENVKQLDRRFWKQLSRRRRNSPTAVSS